MIISLSVPCRVPSGCIVELDALYSGEAIGAPLVLSQGAMGMQPTEDDCCQACRYFCPTDEPWSGGPGRNSA